MSPEERMDHMATLDGSVAGPWAGVGRDQLDWVQKTLADWDKARPVVIFSHNPLYEYYPPWNFWVRDCREVHEGLKPHTNSPNAHRHNHQGVYNQVGEEGPIGNVPSSWHRALPPGSGPNLARLLVAGGAGGH